MAATDPLLAAVMDALYGESRPWDGPARVAVIRRCKVIRSGHTDNLIYDDGHGIRVWVARTGIDDGEPCDHKLTLERSTLGGPWETVAAWNPRSGKRVE